MLLLLEGCGLEVCVGILIGSAALLLVTATIVCIMTKRLVLPRVRRINHRVLTLQLLLGGCHLLAVKHVGDQLRR